MSGKQMAALLAIGGALLVVLVLYVATWYSIGQHP